MPQSLSSFLVSVGVIVAVVLFFPLVESVVRLLRPRPQIERTELQDDPGKVYSRKVA